MSVKAVTSASSVPALKETSPEGLAMFKRKNADTNRWVIDRT